MKYIGYFLLLLTISSCAQKNSKDTYITSVEGYRYTMNKNFANKKTTPFDEEDFKAFRSLDFFPIDTAYRVVANFKKDENPRLFEMPTTTDRKPMYATFGTATFTLNGKEVQLHIYQSKDKESPDFYDTLFLPFTDATSGNESYGGGRYLEPEYPSEGKIVIDFNKSYNPYCVYNSKYSCPIPPKENRLPIAIKAGIKNYETSGNKK